MNLMIVTMIQILDEEQGMKEEVWEGDREEG